MFNVFSSSGCSQSPQTPSNAHYSASSTSTKPLTLYPDTLKSNILTTNMDNNNKLWTSNFLSCKQARVTFNNTYSSCKTLPNGVPQGAVFSSEFLTFSSITSQNPPSSLKIFTYADDLSIEAQNHTANVTTRLFQQYNTIPILPHTQQNNLTNQSGQARIQLSPNDHNVHPTTSTKQ